MMFIEFIRDKERMLRSLVILTTFLKDPPCQGLYIDNVLNQIKGRGIIRFPWIVVSLLSHRNPPDRHVKTITITLGGMHTPLNPQVTASLTKP